MAGFFESYRRLTPFLRPYRYVVLGALACTVGFVLTTPAMAHLVERLTRFIGNGDLQAITELTGMSIGIIVVRGLCQYGQDTLMAKAALRGANDLRNHVHAHVQTLDLGWLAGQRTGDLSYRLTEDIDRIGEVTRKFFHQFIPCVLTATAVLAYLLFLNWQLTFLTLIVTPFIGWLFGWFGNRLLVQSRRSQGQIADLSALLVETFSGIRIIRGFAAEKYEQGRFETLSDQNRLARFRAEQIKAIQYPVIGLLQGTGVLLVFWVAAWQISQGNLTPPQFAGFAAGIAFLIDPVVLITSNLNELREVQASAERVGELLEVQPTVLEAPDARVLPPVQGLIELRNITFGYADARPVLSQINLRVEPGEVVALVGPSGSGKSSLVNLLPRFYDTQSGTVCIDGIDVREVTFKSLRRQIGIVPQETMLFSGTIAENIAYGSEGRSPVEIEEAARIANAHDFILELPAGYQTLVGERGVNLSGGQRQRVAIARAVLLDPKILILDEATSALDNESEALVQEALNRLMRGRTVVVIAHRLSTVRDADRILVLERGQITETGNHGSLLDRGGLYAQLYNRQFERTPV
ncbi:MAG: ABC transporter ATP-binding protein [Gemmatimonadaceae bacterium]|nr:ABC transporter ATP-binding protein [Gloeobacterales cyanobacterium ES-bin-141]